MVIYGVYEDDEYQECRFIGTMNEIAIEFNVTKNSLNNNLYSGKKLQNKYIIKRICTERELYEEIESK